MPPPGDRTDHPHRRESRIQPGQSRCTEYVLWRLYQWNVQRHAPLAEFAHSCLV